MSAPDQQTALAWVKVCQDAALAGEDWRPVSDRFIRSLPEKERVAPWLFSAFVDRREKSGDDPLAVQLVIENCMLILAVDGGDS